MSEEPKRYIAASLEDIAKAFDQFAADQMFLIHRKRTQKAKMGCVTRAAVWNDAAHFLRSTTIVTDEGDNP